VSQQTIFSQYFLLDYVCPEPVLADDLSQQGKNGSSTKKSRFVWFAPVGSSVPSKKNGQRQPEIPTPAATFDENCPALADDLPGSATQPIDPAVIAPADAPITAILSGSMP
jgi:hypothetical protein